MHEMLQLMPQDRDSETGSYTDSGRGPSEEGENSHQPHLETQLVDNNKSKLFRVQDMDYPKLAPPYLYCTCTYKGGPDFSQTVHSTWSQSG